MSRRALALLLALAAIAATGGAAAATAAPVHHTSVNAIETEVMCVACGVPLEIADSPQADRERAYITQLVNRGLTKKQVERALVATYTTRVLAMPQKHGFGLVAFLVPIAAVIAALIALAIGLPRWRRRKREAGSTNTGDTQPLDELDAQRLDEDLASYKL